METLGAMGIATRDRITYTNVMRQPFAYVVYDLAYQEIVRIIHDYCRSIGIPLVGRFSRFEYLNMDGCIRGALDFVKSSPPA